MATHVTGDGEQSGSSLPGVLPFDVAAHSRLSWELGRRVVDDTNADELGAWTHTEATWELSVFRVTATTVVLRVRTPIGRERFFEARAPDAESAQPRLERSTRWRRVE